jgi:hypothetical protein
MVISRLEKFSDVEVKEQYQVNVSNRYTASKILDDDGDDDDDDDDDVYNSRTWESIRKNMKSSPTQSLGYCELKQHKPWFKEQYLKLLAQRKQAKLQWLQNTNQINGDNLKNIRSETNKSFRNKKGTPERKFSKLE